MLWVSDRICVKGKLSPLTRGYWDYNQYKLDSGSTPTGLMIKINVVDGDDKTAAGVDMEPMDKNEKLQGIFLRRPAMSGPLRTPLFFHFY